MRWSLFIFAYVMLALQAGVAPYLALHGATPNLGLIAVLFVALNGRRDGSLIGCFMIGLFQDLLSEQPPGLFAFSYGLVALFIRGGRSMLGRRQSLALLVAAFAAGLLTLFVLGIHGLIHGPRIAFGVGLLQAVYTAALTPVIFWSVERMRAAVFPENSIRRSTVR